MKTRKRPKPKPDPEKRSWVITPDTKVVRCYKSPAADCIVTSLWEAEETAFYDADLARATKEINHIVTNLKNKKDPDRELCFLEVEDRLLLTWTEHGTIGPDDDLNTIKKALRLKEKTVRRKR
jgi:hypothetical protein